MADDLPVVPTVLSTTYATKLATDLSCQQVAAWVRRYVRGNGFDQIGPDAQEDWPRPDLQGVILAAATRLATSGGSISRQSVDGAEVSYFAFQGFNLIEQAILHDYRRRAA